MHPEEAMGQLIPEFAGNAAGGEAEQEDGQRLPPPSLPDHDRPRLRTLAGAGGHGSQRAVGEITDPGLLGSAGIGRIGIGGGTGSQPRCGENGK